MVYKFNGKSIAIPNAELDKIVDNLDCSLSDAIELWLNDNDYTENQEQKQLNEKAKTVKTANIIKAASAKPKTQRERVQKPDEVKEGVIKIIADALTTYGAEVQITDTRKLITFKLGNDDFKINLTRTRKLKGE